MMIIHNKNNKGGEERKVTVFETKKLAKEDEQRIDTYWNIYEIMKDPSLTFERIRDVTQKSNVIHRDFKEILSEIEKDDSCQLPKNTKITSQRCIHVRDLLEENKDLPINCNPNPFNALEITKEPQKYDPKKIRMHRINEL